jgi:hypothetical protein
LQNGQFENKNDIKSQGKLCRAFATNTEKRLERLEDFVAAQNKQASNNNPMSESSTTACQKVPTIGNNTTKLRRTKTITSANNETCSKIPDTKSEVEQTSRVETSMTILQDKRHAVVVDHGTFSTMIPSKLALFFDACQIR